MAWYHRVVINFHLIHICLKLIVKYMNPFSSLFLNPICFHLIKKARETAASNLKEKMTKGALVNEVSFLN